MKQTIVAIPSTAEHGGYTGNIIKVDIGENCFCCKKPRVMTKVFLAASFDGSRRLIVSGWENECLCIEGYGICRELGTILPAGTPCITDCLTSMYDEPIIPGNVFYVKSSDGEWLADKTTGRCYTTIPYDTGTGKIIITEFNILEYKEFWGVEELPASIDILNIGYWWWSTGKDKKINYEEPEADWRNEIKQSRG